MRATAPELSWTTTTVRDVEVGPGETLERDVQLLSVHPALRDRGYDPAGNQALDEGTPPDLKEAWAFSPEDSAGSSPMQGDNQWPDLDGIRVPVTRYHQAAMALGASPGGWRRP